MIWILLTEVILLILYTSVQGQLEYNVTTDLPTGEVFTGIGGELEVLCEGREGGIRVNVVWSLNYGEGDTLVGNGSKIGTTEVIIAGAFNSILRLNNFSVETNGTIAKCGIVSMGSVRPQPEPFPVLVILPPPIIVSEVSMDYATEGNTYILNFSIRNIPISPKLTLKKDGKDTPLNGERFIINQDSFTISEVKRTDSGNYTIQVTTVAGSDTVTFCLAVHYVAGFPSLYSTETVVEGNAFVFNCTPTSANPPPSSYVFQRDEDTITEGVNGPIFIIPSLSRAADVGNYTCIVTNAAGTVTIATFLNVLATPFAPQDLEVRLNGPFSVAITWNPPSDRGGTVQPLSYSIRVTNSTYDMIFNTLLTELTLTMSNGVWHSTMYSVTVAAENEAGSGSFVGSNFITPDSVPIIDSISVEVLPYSLVSLVVELLTTGGRNINKYEVKIIKTTGHNSPIIDQEIVITLNDLVPFQYTIVDDQYYNITVIAINSVGSSDPITTVTLLEPASTGVTPLSDNLVGISVGGALGGFFLGVLITALCLLGVIICYRRQCCRNVMCADKEAKDQDVFYEVYELENEMAQSPQPYEIPVGINKPIANEQSASEQEEQQQGQSGEAVSKNDTLYI